MSPPLELPIYCSLQAYRLFQVNAADLTTTRSMLIAAVAISSHGNGEYDLGFCTNAISYYARKVRSRTSGRHQQGLLAHLHEILFEKEGFRADPATLTEPECNYIGPVLKGKIGSPSMLCLIYKAVAEELGINVDGISIPGMFLARVRCRNSEPMFIDCSNQGRALTAEEIVQELDDFQAAEAEDFLEPITNDLWISRILDNLLQSYMERNLVADAAAAVELMLSLWPNNDSLYRDLGLTYGRLGRNREALMCLIHYLQIVPNDPQKAEIQEVINLLA
jgi:regulator of sirC expression with transglutaminase-like and TPR domain